MSSTSNRATNSLGGHVGNISQNPMVTGKRNHYGGKKAKVEGLLSVQLDN